MELVNVPRASVNAGSLHAALSDQSEGWRRFHNIVHSYSLPLVLATVAVAFGGAGMLPYLYIWTAHIGLDRLLGYGLKYPTAFGRTHLGNLAKGAGTLVP
jgi:hypothetical protein